MQPDNKRDQHDEVIRNMDLFPGEFETPKAFFTVSHTLMPFAVQKWTFHLTAFLLLYSLAVVIMDLMQVIDFNPILDISQWYYITLAQFSIWTIFLGLHYITSLWAASADMPQCEYAQPMYQESMSKKRSRATVHCFSPAKQALLNGRRWDFSNRLTPLYFKFAFISSLLWGAIYVVYRDRNNAPDSQNQSYINNSGNPPYYVSSRVADALLFVVSGWIFALLFILEIPNWGRIAHEMWNVDRVMQLFSPGLNNAPIRPPMYAGAMVPGYGWPGYPQNG